MDILKQYNQIGKNYIEGQRNFCGKRERESTDFIVSSISSNVRNKVVLDIGCGEGSLLKKCTDAGAEESWGIDPSEYMIEQCKINVPNHERVIVAQAENMPFESDMFDVIVSQYALHYVAQLDEAYKEIHRVMKSGGIISFVVHHPFKDLACADSKIYGQQQLAKFKLYDNLVEITFPTHTFKDYFSDYFLSCFDVISIVEEQSPEERLEDKLYIVPGYLGVTARKK